MLCTQAARITHSPIGTIRPFSSMMGMKLVRHHQFAAAATPAQQHLHRMQAARADIHDGLEVQLELVGRQRAAQAGLQLEVARRRLVHRLLKNW
jgi:hypothetical protein